MQIKS